MVTWLKKQHQISIPLVPFKQFADFVLIQFGPLIPADVPSHIPIALRRPIPAISRGCTLCKICVCTESAKDHRTVIANHCDHQIFKCIESASTGHSKQIGHSPSRSSKASSSAISKRSDRDRFGLLDFERFIIS